MNKQSINNCDKACAEKKACATKACDKTACDKQAKLKLDACAGIDNAENLPAQPPEFEAAEVANFARLKHNEELMAKAGACQKKCAGACAKGAKADKAWAAKVDTDFAAAPPEFEEAEVANFARLKHNEELMAKTGACEKRCPEACERDAKPAKDWSEVNLDFAGQPAEFENAEVANFARLRMNEACIKKAAGACEKKCTKACAGDADKICADKVCADKACADKSWAAKVNTDFAAQPAEFEKGELANFARLRMNEACMAQKYAPGAMDVKNWAAGVNTDFAAQPAEFEQAELDNFARLIANEKCAKECASEAKTALCAERDAALAAWDKSDSAALERLDANEACLGVQKGDLTLDSTMKYTERQFQTKAAHCAATKLDKHANINVTKISDVSGADRIGGARLTEEARRA